jgi:hypothetical protein
MVFSCPHYRRSRRTGAHDQFSHGSTGQRRHFYCATDADVLDLPAPTGDEAGGAAIGQRTLQEAMHPVHTLAMTKHHYQTGEKTGDRHLLFWNISR